MWRVTLTGVVAHRLRYALTGLAVLLGVAFIVLDHDYGDWITHLFLFRLLMVQLIGSVIVNVLPRLSSEATDMVPPSRRTRVRTCASPMPCPGLSWVPARRNRSKMR